MFKSKKKQLPFPDLCDGLQLTRKLGEGGMGTVYEAIQLNLKRKVAVKVLSAGFAADHDFLERFKREARTAAAVDHPNLVQVHDIGQSAQGIHYISMEYVAGENLEQRLRRTDKIPLNEALGIVRSVAAALRAALAKNIIHRDIKPENIMITTEGEIKLTDLGLAKVLTDETSVTLTGMGIGSPHFIAPEQAEDAGHVDHRADIYSLGITLLNLLTGKRPFTANSPFALVKAHSNKPLPKGVELGTELPAEIDEFIEWMSAKTPEERLPSYDRMISIIDTLQTDVDATIVIPPSARIEVASKTLKPTGSTKPSRSTGSKNSRDRNIAATEAFFTEAFQRKLSESITKAEQRTPDRHPWIFGAAGLLVVLFVIFAVELSDRSAFAASNPIAHPAHSESATATENASTRPFKEFNSSNGLGPRSLPTSRPRFPFITMGYLHRAPHFVPRELPIAPPPMLKATPIPPHLEHEEMLVRSQEYCTANPKNFRSILTLYEQCFRQARTAEQEDMTIQQLKIWIDRMEAEFETVSNQMVERMKPLIEAGEYVEAYDVWQDYPAELQAFKFEQRIFDLVTGHFPAEALTTLRRTKPSPRQMF
jgi:serine/threonine protein kinase